MIVKNIGDNLSQQELLSLSKNPETSRLNNGVTITIYQGDEPEQDPEPVVLQPDWNGLKQALWGNANLLGKAYVSCVSKPQNALGVALLSDTMKDGHDGIGTQNGFLK